jgi:hypothetical protein
MQKKKQSADFFGFLLIPIISAILWCAYYGINMSSRITLIEMVLPVYLGCFVIGEFILWALPGRFSRLFRFGFWVGALLIAPFYMFKISYLTVLYNIPLAGYMLYACYVVSGIIAAIAFGVILWALGGLVTGIKKSPNPALFAGSRVALILVCVALFIPIIRRDQEVQPDLMKEQTSYRAFQQRATDIVPKHKVVFLGVDGADWQVMEPMIKDGKLKNIQSLMERGRWGTLESIKPIRSPMVWNTIFTGQNPDKHGIVEWLLSYSENRLVKGIWNILSEYNLKTTIINIPGTFPPEDFLGKEVSGFPYPTQTMNIYGWVIGTEKIKTRVTPFIPIELNLKQDGSYGSAVSVSERISSKYSNEMKGKILKNMLIENYIQGRLGEIYGEKIDVVRLNFYEDDKRIDILPLLGSETPLASLHEGDWSDFVPVQIEPGVIGVTKFKALKIDKGNIMLFMTPFFSRSDAPRFDFTFPKTLSKDLYDLFGQYIVETTWWSARDPFLLPAIVELVGEVEKTKARVGETLFDEKQWDLFIQVFTYTDRMQHLAWYFAHDKVPEDLYINLFNADEIKSDGLKAIEDAYVMADEWLGYMIRKIDFDKDVVFVSSDHGFTAGTGMQYLSGVHRLDGMYIIAGGPVNPVSSSDFMQNMAGRKSVRDLTKNMLYMMGLPIGQDMAGDVWRDIFGEYYASANPVTSIPTYNKEETEKEARHLIDQSAIEQLKGLGYLNGGNVEGNTE